MSKVDIRTVHHEALGCTRCRLSESRTQVVWADGNLDADLLFIGEGPGFHEDKQGIPFVGAAGQLLDKLLAEIGLDRTSAAIVNVVKCRPPGNRDPRPDEIEACRPYLEAQLAHMQPRVIVTLGNFATRFILEEQVGITRARGRRYERRGSTVIPTFHPAAALRGGRFGGLSPIDAIREDLRLVQTVLGERPEPDPGSAPDQDNTDQDKAGRLDGTPDQDNMDQDNAGRLDGTPEQDNAGRLDGTPEQTPEMELASHQLGLF